MAKIAKNSACASMNGIKRVEFIDASDLYYTLPKDGGVELMAKKGWSKVDFIPGDANYTCESAEGGAYTISLELTSNATSNGYERELDSMRNRRFVLRVTDNNGIAWIVGRKEEPLRFSYSHVNTGGVGGSRNYALRWYRSSHYDAAQEK